MVSAWVLPDLSPINPPDTNGRVGATQYVQWNNTSFAVFDKSRRAALRTGRRQHALPVARRRLRHAQRRRSGRQLRHPGRALGPLAVRRRRPAGSASHQCVAVSVDRRRDRRLLPLRLRHRPDELRRLPAHRRLAGRLLHDRRTSSTRPARR